MRHPNLRSYLETLKREGELCVIEEPVNPFLELAEIQRRVVAGQGPAHLFLGGPPALTMAAIAPLPENVPEMVFASLLLQGRLPDQALVPTHCRTPSRNGGARGRSLAQGFPGNVRAINKVN